MARQEDTMPGRPLRGVEGGAGLEAPSSNEVAALGPEAVSVATRVSSPGRDAWRRFRRNRAAMLSLGFILLMVIMAAFAPFMHTVSPVTPDYGAIDAGPSGAHWFGADELGRDIYSRLVYGFRVPLLVGLIGTLVTVAMGTTMGVCSGFFGGIIDSVLARVTDAFFAFPAFLLALLSVALFGSALDPVFGGAGRVILLTIVFAGVSWPPLMRFVRSLALAMREQQFVEAARTAGSSNYKIIRRHLLPNMFGLILVQAALLTATIVYTETTLSIFGLGIEPPAPDPGQMLYDAQQQLFASVPGGIYSELIFTSLFLVALLVAFTFVGDGVRDAVDPRMNA